eukprot:gene10410-2939_t
MITAGETRRLWKKRVEQNGWDLEKAPNYLKYDEEIVIAAVNQDPTSLGYAADELRENREIALKCYPLTVLPSIFFPKN